MQGPTKFSKENLAERIANSKEDEDHYGHNTSDEGDHSAEARLFLHSAVTTRLAPSASRSPTRCTDPAAITKPSLPAHERAASSPDIGSVASLTSVNPTSFATRSTLVADRERGLSASVTTMPMALWPVVIQFAAVTPRHRSMHRPAIATT